MSYKSYIKLDKIGFLKGYSTLPYQIHTAQAGLNIQSCLVNTPQATLSLKLIYKHARTFSHSQRASDLAVLVRISNKKGSVNKCSISVVSSVLVTKHKKVGIQTLLYSRAHVILLPLIQGEVTKTYIDPSLWRNLSLRWENLSALQTAYGRSKIRLLPCVRERCALLVSCTRKRKPLVQQEHGSGGTAKPLQPIPARPRFALTRMPKVHFYEPSCQSCKMSSAINEKKQ